MIFKQLINLWNDDSGLKEIFDEFDTMLIIGKEVFDKASGNLFNPAADMEAEAREIVKLDGKLNALQQTIRKDIVIHISVKESKDILPCLMLMSIVKDAERLGDYSKNILEIAERFTDFERGKYFERLKEMRTDILKYFDDTKIAFDGADSEHAEKVRESAFNLEKECDKIAWEMIATKDKKDAVALALLFRFYKRVAAHLGNICTSVIMPLDKLDYYEES